jgi:hypothetical protein
MESKKYKLPGHKGKFMKGQSSQYQIAMEKSIIKNLERKPKNKEMKVAIIGSRTFQNKNSLFLALNDFRRVLRATKHTDITEIVSGGAQGADFLAEEYANESKIKKTIFKADWSDMSLPCSKKTNAQGKEYNALAGFKRNTQIIDYCDQVIAFWDGKSPGTRDSIEKAKAQNKPVKIVKI